MFCPRCAMEIPDGAESCRECGATLVSKTADDELEVVTVFVTNDAAALAVAKSLLDAEGIECEVQGESGQEALGLGPFPGATGPMRLMVARSDGEAARGLLTQSSEAANPEP